jgi:hypothetical protein
MLIFDGDWERYVEQVYEAFRGDLIESDVRFRGLPVAVRRVPFDRGKEAGFWHVMQEGPIEDERIPDIRRCERVRWIRALIECNDSEKVQTWESKRGSELRVVIALDDFTYVVVLSMRKGYVLLITAYAVEETHRQRKLSREYDAWVRSRRASNKC